MAATQEQIQRFVDERLRPRAEQIRGLLAAMKDDRAAIDDVYSELNGGGTFTDTRQDGPPHLATASDVLAMNTLLANLVTAIEGNAQYPIAQKLCVRPAAQG
jgi:hypothetical protein